MKSVAGICFVAAIFAVLGGCRPPLSARVNSLDSEQKLEGFLAILEIKPSLSSPTGSLTRPSSSAASEASSETSFQVTCVSSDGKKYTETRSKSEIVRNEICKKAVAGGSIPGSVTSTPQASPTAAGNASRESATIRKYEVTMLSSVRGQSYFKLLPNMNVSGGLSAYRLGEDYCLSPRNLTAESVCRSGAGELKVTNVTIAGCSLTSGYLYAAHYSVLPATISQCQ